MGQSKSGLAYMLVLIAGNVSNMTQTHKLLHGDKTMVFSDVGYHGVNKRPGKCRQVGNLVHRDEAQRVSNMKKNLLC